MFTVLVSSALCSLLMIFAICRQKGAKLLEFESIGATMSAAGIGLFIGIIVAGILGNFLPMKTDISTHPIVSVRSGDNFSGSLIFGVGSFGETAEYHMYVKNNDGSIARYTLPADQSTSIFEDPQLKHAGIWEVKRAVVDRSGALALWAFSIDWDPGYNCLRVPVGTVIQTFRIQ